MFRKTLQMGSERKANTSAGEIGRCPVCGEQTGLTKPEWFPSETCVNCEDLLRSLGWEAKWSKNIVSVRTISPGSGA